MFRVDGSALYNLINERPTALLIVDAREPDVFAAGVFTPRVVFPGVAATLDCLRRSASKAFVQRQDGR
jgi:hypothetical protein